LAHFLPLVATFEDASFPTPFDEIADITQPALTPMVEDQSNLGQPLRNGK
jgi:hypothetical protein